MDVTFTKRPGRRYTMTVAREVGPELAPRQGPGYDDHLPHDAVHFLVEAEAGLTGGAFGRIAAGRNNIFWPADPALRRRESRRGKRSVSSADHADMRRSERLATICRHLWEVRTGHLAQPPDWFSLVEQDVRDRSLIERILTRMDGFAARWAALPVDGSVTLHWPTGAGRTAVKAGAGT